MEGALREEGQTLHIQHTHPAGAAPEAREEALRRLYCSCLRELQGQGWDENGLCRRRPVRRDPQEGQP